MAASQRCTVIATALRLVDSRPGSPLTLATRSIPPTQGPYPRPAIAHCARPAVFITMQACAAASSSAAARSTSVRPAQAAGRAAAAPQRPVMRRRRASRCASGLQWLGGGQPASVSHPEPWRRPALPSDRLQCCRAPIGTHHARWPQPAPLPPPPPPAATADSCRLPSPSPPPPPPSPTPRPQQASGYGQRPVARGAGGAGGGVHAAAGGD